MVDAVANILATREFPTPNDRAFFQRIFATRTEVYETRLAGLRLGGRERVLDAGSGFGQWTLALARANRAVAAVDISAFRLSVLSELAARTGVDGVHPARADIGSLPYPDRSFDAVFCYGAVFFGDARRTLAEFARVLRAGGLLYFCASGVGWYLYNLIESHNPVAGFSPRRDAAAAIAASARYYLTGAIDPKLQLIMPRRTTRRTLERLGFCDIRVGGEGALSGGRSFFPATKYGLTAVYEMTATRS
jgi:ubiquinone/menaquinone biosynthesis C-methylase UbiE